MDIRFIIAPVFGLDDIYGYRVCIDRTGCQFEFFSNIKLMFVEMLWIMYFEFEATKFVDTIHNYNFTMEKCQNKIKHYQFTVIKCINQINQK